MSKVIVAAVILVAAAVAVVATGGAAISALAPALAGSFGAASAVTAWATIAAVTWSLGVVGSAINKPQSQQNNGANQTQVKLAGGRAPRPIVFGRTGTAGYITYRDCFDTKNAFLAVLTLLCAGGPIQGIESHIMGDGYVANFDGDPHNGLYHVRSLTPAPVGSDGSKLYIDKTAMIYSRGDTPAGSWSVVSGTPQLPNMGANFKTSGYAGALGIYRYDTAAYPAGYPKGLWVVKGVKCWDPRKDSTWPGGSGSHRIADKTTWEFSENPYVCALNFILGRFENGKKVWGLGVPAASLADQVDVTAFISGANVSDANGWKVGGSVETTDDKFAVLGAILQAGGGQAVARGAQLSVVVNAPKASIATITTADIVGDISITTGAALKDTHNIILPSYRPESQRWQVISGERIGIADWIAEDNGEEHSVEVNYSLVQNAAQAHQLAAYDICNSRDAGFRATVVCGPRFLTVRVGDCLTLDVPQLGASSQKCLVVERAFDPATLQVTLTLQAESDSKHAFALGQSQTAPASPALQSYDPSNPDAPSSGAWAITGTAITTSAGVSVPALVVDGANDDVNALNIVAEYRPYGSANWITAGSVAKDTTRIEITPVTAGTSYEVAISYNTVRGVRGARLVLGPVTAGAHVIDYGGSAATGVVNLPTGLVVDTDGYLSAGGVRTTGGQTVEEALSTVSGGAFDSTPPAIPTGLSLSSSLNADQTSALSATWTPPSDSDLQGYEIGLSTNGGGEVVFAASAATYSVNLPAATPVVVRVRALDKAGNRSGWTSTASLTTTADTTAPAAPTGFAITSTIQSAWLTWTNASALDLDHVEIWKSATNDTSTAAQVATASAAPGASGRFTFSGQATGVTSYYWLKSVDRSGNKSGFSAGASGTPVKVTSGDITVDTVIANSVFSNVTSTGVLNANVLQSGTSLPALLKLDSTGFTLGTIAANASAGAWRNGLEADEVGAAIVASGNTLAAYTADKFAGSQSALLTSTAAYAASGSAGSTTGVGFTIPTEAAIGFSTKRVKVTVYAKQPSSNASPQFAVSYSTNEVGNSGWQVFTPTTSWAPYSFYFTVPTPAAGGFDYVGVFADTGSAGRGVLIDNITVEPSSEDLALDPATQVNAASTLIAPGRIQLTGATTITNWLAGGDNTQIDGGKVYTNTIKANSIQIGARNIDTVGLSFSMSSDTTTLSWTSGYILYTADNGSQAAVNVAAGSTPRRGVFTYVAWTKDSTSLAAVGSDGTGGDWSTVRADPNRLIMASWFGNVIAPAYGGTIIDGRTIATGTIFADQIATASLTADKLATSNITVSLGVGSSGKISIDGANNRIVISD